MVAVLKIKIVFILFLLFISALFLVMIVCSASEVNQVVIDTPNKTIAEDIKIRLDTCVPNKSTERNIVIVIDASGSTALGDQKTGLNYISLIDANAINIIQNITSFNNVGVVAFGGVTRKTALLSMGSEANRTYFEKFIRDTGPTGGEKPTDLDNGLRTAGELLNSVNGTKEVIVFSDGEMRLDNFDQLKKIVVNLKNGEIKTHFVQVLITNDKDKYKFTNELYNELAQAADGKVVILNPDERSVVHSEVPSFEEPCPMGVNEPILISITSSEGIPIKDADISFDDNNIGITDYTGKLSFTTFRIGLHNITATKPGYTRGAITVQVLPTQNVTSSYPTATINPTIRAVKEVKEPLNGSEGFENKSSWLESVINSVLGWLKSIS